MSTEHIPATLGRPPKYDPAFHPAWAERMAKLGATDKDLADAFDVTEMTINTWKRDHPAFFLSLKKGKHFADAEVASKLFHRATGYEHEEVDVKVIDGQVVLTPLIKHYAPDSTAAIFWLKNRRPDLWRDKPPEATDNEESKPVKVVVEVKDARKPDADS